MSYPVEFEPVIQALNQSGVRYVLVDGLAVVAHGVDRLTADIDVVLDLERCASALEALTNLGYRPRAPVKARDFADPSKRRTWIAEKGMRVFSLWDPDNRLPVIDLFAEYPIEFEGLVARSESIRVGGSVVRVASIEDLIEMKRRAGRDKDRSDIMALDEQRSRRER